MAAKKKIVRNKKKPPVERVEIDVTIGCTVQAYGGITLHMPKTVLNASEATRNSWIERAVKKRMHDVPMECDWSGSEGFRIVQATAERNTVLLLESVDL